MRTALTAALILLGVIARAGDDTVRMPPDPDADPAVLARVQERLNEVVIPEVCVSNANLGDVVNLLVELTMRNDSNGVGCSLILNLTPPPTADDEKMEPLSLPETQLDEDLSGSPCCSRLSPNRLSRVSRSTSSKLACPTSSTQSVAKRGLSGGLPQSR